MKRVVLCASVFLCSCVPDVYLIDRQTVLELEASGSWPELDQKYKGEIQNAAPVSLEEAGPKVEQRKLFQMTHADQETKSETPAQK